MNTGHKILTFGDLRERGVLLGRRQIDRLEAQGKFPKRVKISEKRVGWLAEEIRAYVDGKIKARN